MKKIIMLLVATIPLLCVNTQAMASFEDGHLIRVVFSASGILENATDLGPISYLTYPSAANISYHTNNFNLAALGAGADTSNFFVTYFALTLKPNPKNQAWISGPVTGQTASRSNFSNFASKARTLTAWYDVDGNHASQVTFKKYDADSFWNLLSANGGGIGKFANFISAGNAAQSLADLTTVGYVDQVLYYYGEPAGIIGTMPGLNISTIRTYAEGDTELNPVPMLLTVTKTGSGTVTSSPAGISCGSTCNATYDSWTEVTLTASPENGSIFTGWSEGGCSGTATCTVILKASTGVTATFSANNQTDTQANTQTDKQTNAQANTQTGNLINTKASSQTDKQAIIQAGTQTNTQVDTQANPQSNMQIDKQTNTQANTQIDRQLKIQNNTLTVSKTGPGSGTVTSSEAGISCGNTCSASYKDGTQLTLTAVPASGSVFNGWAGSGGCPTTDMGTVTCKVTANTDTRVTAMFVLKSTPKYILTVKSANGTVTGAGINCGRPGSDCSGKYYSGTNVNLIALPATGYKFTGWIDACSGTNPKCTITVNNADKTVTAKFARLKKYTLKVATRKGGFVTSSPSVINCDGTIKDFGKASGKAYGKNSSQDSGKSCSKQYLEDTSNTIQLTAKPIPGYKFKGWSGACKGTNLNCTVTVNNADKTVTAKFAKS